MHLYDHCPYCVRAELTLGWHGVPFERVVYGYGEGANPENCGGTGYGATDGPIKLTGKKMLPVLEGEAVPAPEGMVGLPESLEICSYVAGALGPGQMAPATGRGDIDGWLGRLRPVSSKLVLPRFPKMPVKDWADPRDAEYARWKYVTKSAFNYEEAEAATPQLLEEAGALLEELVPMLRGTTTVDGASVPCLNKWGFSMDDILVLPLLRNLTCVAGLKWPAQVRTYLESICGKAGVKLYTENAV